MLNNRSLSHIWAPLFNNSQTFPSSKKDLVFNQDTFRNLTSNTQNHPNLMKKILTTSIIAGSALTSFGAITTSVDVGTFDTAVNPREGTVSLTVNTGDVVVLIATTNKKTSVSTLTFSTTSGDALTSNSVDDLTSNPNANPDSFSAWTTITTAGTFDFTTTATLDQTPTVNWVAYVLSSDTGTTIEHLDTTAAYTSALASGTADLTNSLTWTGSRDATVITALGSTNGTLLAPTGFTIDKDGGNANSSRHIGHQDVTADGGYDTVSTLTWTQNTASAGSISLAFSEAVPEPSSAALLGLGGLALIFRRRK